MFGPIDEHIMTHSEGTFIGWRVCINFNPVWDNVFMTYLRRKENYLNKMIKND